MVNRSILLEDLAAPAKNAFATGPFGSAVSSRNFQSSGVPMLRGNNLSVSVDVRLDESDLVFLSEELASRFARSIVRTDDLIFTCWGTIGQIGIIDKNATYEYYIVSNKQMKMTPDPNKVDPLYLYYNLSQDHVIDQVQSQAIGSSVPGFNLGQLRRIRLELHTLTEQRIIAEVLGVLDDRITANTKLIDTAQELACALLAKHQASVPLHEIVTHEKRTIDPTTLDFEAVLHYSLPAFDIHRRAERCLPLEIKSSKFVVTRPSVLVSKLNPRFPRVWDVIAISDEPALASTEFVVLESKYSSSTVLWAILSQQSFSLEIQSKVAGTSGSHQRVRPAELLATEVIDPRVLSDVVHAQITQLGQRIACARTESTTLAALRDALLPQLMSGRLRVKDAEKLVEERV